MLKYKQGNIGDCVRLLRMYAFVCEKDAILKFAQFDTSSALFGDISLEVKRLYLGMVNTLRDDKGRRIKLELMVKTRQIPQNIVEILKEQHIV